MKGEPTNLMYQTLTRGGEKRRFCQKGIEIRLLYQQRLRYNPSPICIGQIGSSRKGVFYFNGALI